METRDTFTYKKNNIIKKEHDIRKLDFIYSYNNFKKLIDFSAALLGIIIFSPILIAISLLIKLTSQGPVLFLQERIGKDSKRFTIYKFRTMIVGCPNVPTDEMKYANQYRTKIGGIIRKLSLDELPQLFNILKGDMSFIGPRPMIKEHEYLIHERKKKGIDKLYPGISGLAQVNGRDDITDQIKLNFDQKYMESFSFIIDFKIFIKTIFKIMKKEDISL